MVDFLHIIARILKWYTDNMTELHVGTSAKTPPLPSYRYQTYTGYFIAFSGDQH